MIQAVCDGDRWESVCVKDGWKLDVDDPTCKGEENSKKWVGRLLRDSWSQVWDSSSLVRLFNVAPLDPSSSAHRTFSQTTPEFTF